jgi:chromosome segregation protein
MRLKKLILHGFKSFADRTEFSFDSPITGIVGPNGCGKSNVVDAFKWVLGEQSAKSLRGDAMLDVIFNGAASRKPAGLAEVTLVFGNPKNADDKRTLNLDMDEVAVGRRLYRDGTSEYHLNNQTSRLKDVRELFLDTGVGVDAYSVIEQGRVAALLDANPQERRLIFEEAAGISKFKQRKKEAQRKLERVDQNLLRVNDVVEEVEKRLRSVKAQAGRARTYQEHQAKLSELRLSLSLHDYHLHTTRLAELEKNREELQFRFDDATGDLAHAQNELAETRDHLTALSEQKQSIERELVQAQMAVQSARQRQQYAQQQIAQTTEQLASFEHDQTELKAKQQAMAQSLEAEQRNLQSLTEELSAQRQLIEQRQKSFGDCQLRLAKFDQEREQAKSRILELLRQLAGVNSRLGAVEIERKNVTAQQSRLAERQRIVTEDLTRLELVQGDLQRKLDQIAAQMSEQQQQLEQKRVAAQALGKQITQITEQLGAAREHRSAMITRQKLLEDLEARRHGVSEGVQSVLRHRAERFPFVRGLVADVLRVDIENAQVIEAALDGRDQWLVTNDSTAVAGARHYLADLEGRVNILCTDAMPTHEPHGWTLPESAQWALDLVRFETEDAPLARALLGTTVVVNDLNTAISLRQSTLKKPEDGHPQAFPLRFVTRQAEVLEPDGTVRAGPLTAAMGLLSRRSELQAIMRQIVDVDDRIGRLTRQLSDDNTVLRNALYQSNTVKVQTSGAIAQNTDALASLNREQPLLATEFDQLEELAGQLDTEQLSLSAKRSAFESDQSAMHAHVEELTASQRTAADDLHKFGEELTAARVQVGQAQEKQLAARQTVQRHTATLAELAEQIERIAKSTGVVTQRQKIIERELAAAVSDEAAVSRTESELKEKVEAAAADLAERNQSTEQLMTRVEELRSARQDVEQDLHKLELSAGEENVRLQSTVQRAAEEMGLDVPAKYAELTADGKAFEPEGVNFEEVAAQIKELREKIMRLGNVNVDAIGELAELEQRQQFLVTQVTDLTSSKEQLVSLIDEINKESGVRFEQTFAAVREHFQGMFRKLFGGGKADVCLETDLAPPENQPVAELIEGQPAPAPVKIDPLEAGIEIIARPPGKQPVTISQLSGGEKTMTCVALLMSIFKSKPSPFCILDEVDAALDEANNERFNTVVREFLDISQFIVITHSKRTMRIAETLYGVTMQEQGVSKRVAVKFDEIDTHGRISQTAISRDIAPGEIVKAEPVPAETAAA